MGFELDLFQPVSSGDGAWTISTITARARQLIESGLPLVWVKGEVTNFKAYRSGHWYFTLRDATAQIRTVMWRDDNRRLPLSVLDEGLQVFVEARPTVWEERGEFRLTIKRLIPTDGGGLWELQLQKAKAALERDGLLDPSRKRPLPRYPSRIAAVTSPDGAALRDIVSVLRRRWPSAELLIVPTRVQGEDAEKEICAALRLTDRIPDLDLVIVGRGGGSREDLWAFNTEKVARAVVEVRVPVISAVGHETDIGLTDLVADARAATPSVAAETAVPSQEEARRAVDALAQRLGRSLTNRSTLGRERLERTRDRLTAAMQKILQEERSTLRELAGRLETLSPLKILQRGYAVPRDKGRVLKSTANFEPNMSFTLTVADGDVDARVAEISDE